MRGLRSFAPPHPRPPVSPPLAEELNYLFRNRRRNRSTSSVLKTHHPSPRSFISFTLNRGQSFPWTLVEVDEEVFLLDTWVFHVRVGILLHRTSFALVVSTLQAPCKLFTRVGLTYIKQMVGKVLRSSRTAFLSDPGEHILQCIGSIDEKHFPPISVCMSEISNFCFRTPLVYEKVPECQIVSILHPKLWSRQTVILKGGFLP